MESFKRAAPIIVIIGLMLFTGAGLHQGLLSSKEPLVATDDPRRVSNSLPEVVLYSTDWCGYCKEARLYFKAKQVAFIEKDIEKETLAAQEYRRYGGNGVPFIRINNRNMQGFSAKVFKGAYLEELDLDTRSN